MRKSFLKINIRLFRILVGSKKKTHDSAAVPTLWDGHSVILGDRYINI